MEIILRNTKDLIPYEKNAKKHDKQQIENVANSIKRFGWQQPIVIDDNDVVVIGHCRLMAAKKLRLKQVPVTVASGLTEEEIRELRIADNKTNESEWDFALLGEDLKGLSFDGFDFDFDIPQLYDDEKTEPADEKTESPALPESKIYVCCISAFGTDTERIIEIGIDADEAERILQHDANDIGDRLREAIHGI